jgi:hypothetical protein
MYAAGQEQTLEFVGSAVELLALRELSMPLDRHLLSQNHKESRGASTEGSSVRRRPANGETRLSKSQYEGAQ